MAAVAQLKSLQSLSLCISTLDSSEDVGALTALPRLRHLQLSNCGISDYMAPRLATSSRASRASRCST